MKCPNCGSQVSQVNGEFFCMKCGQKVDVSKGKKPGLGLSQNQVDKTVDTSKLSKENLSKEPEESKVKVEQKNVKKKPIKKSMVDSIYPNMVSGAKESKGEDEKVSSSSSGTNPNVSEKIDDPRGLAQLLSDSFNIFVKNIKNFVLLVVTIQLPLLLFIYIPMYLILGNELLRQVTTSGGINSEDMTQEQVQFIYEKISSPFVIIPGIFIILLAIFLSVLLTISIIIAASKAVKGEEINIFNCYKEALKKFFSYIWVNLLMGLAVLGGFVLLIIPGIIFAIWFVFAAYKLVIDNVKGSEALSESRNLVSGYWWKIFGNLIVAGLLVGMASSIISMPFSLLSDIIPFISIIPSIIQQTIGVFTVVFMVLLYFDLKAVKEV